MHLIAAWNISEVEGYLQDRMFCRRTGRYVPLSMKEYPPSVKLNLAFKVKNCPERYMLQTFARKTCETGRLNCL